jgi:hypothetical protein
MASLAKRCLAFCSLFEAEVLLELMMRHWDHPLANDKDFRNALLESATEVLQEAVRGRTVFIEGLPPKKMNFVAAVYYCESISADPATGEDRAIIEGRQRWCENLRRALPSCFVDQGLLPP